MGIRFPSPLRLVHTERIMKGSILRRLKTGEDYEILGQIFSNLLEKNWIFKQFWKDYLRFIILPCLKPRLQLLVFHNLFCVNWALSLCHTKRFPHRPERQKKKKHRSHKPQNRPLLFSPRQYLHVIHIIFPMFSQEN